MDMEKIIITANIGSVSKKYALVQVNDTGTKILHQQHSESGDYTDAKYQMVLADFLAECVSRSYLKRYDQLSAISLRIVASGTYFQTHRPIGDEYNQKLQSAAEIAPLHLAEQLTEYRIIRDLLPTIPVFGISDSAFHRTIPDYISRYAIPRNDSEQYDIRRFGYHGLSVASLISRAKQIIGTLPARIVVCHLGGGCSVTALKNGISIENSMGTTPLEGLIMSTRSGDIDPGALLALAKAKNLTYDELRDYLNKESGLKGLSGVSDDIRILLVAEQNDNLGAKEALDAYTHRIRKYIGAYTAILGGIDLLILAGTVSERSAPIRERILKDLNGLGILHDTDKNMTHADQPQDIFIERENSSTRIAILYTDEFTEMAKETKKLLAL